MSEIYANELWDKLSSIVQFNENNSNLYDKYMKFILEYAKGSTNGLNSQKRLLEKFLSEKEDSKNGHYSFTTNLYFLLERVSDMINAEEIFNDSLTREYDEVVKTKLNMIKKDTREWKNMRKKSAEELNKENQKVDNQFKRYQSKHTIKETTYANYMRAENNKSLSRNQVENFENIYRQRLKEYETEKNDYIKALEYFNEQQRKYYSLTISEWGTVGKLIETNRYDLIKSNFMNLSELCKSLASKFNEISDKIEEKMEEIDINKDLEMLVDKEKTGDVPPCDIPFKDLDQVTDQRQNYEVNCTENGRQVPVDEISSSSGSNKQANGKSKKSSTTKSPPSSIQNAKSNSELRDRISSSNSAESNKSNPNQQKPRTNSIPDILPKLSSSIPLSRKSSAGTNSTGTGGGTSRIFGKFFAGIKKKESSPPTNESISNDQENQQLESLNEVYSVLDLDVEDVSKNDNIDEFYHESDDIEPEVEIEKSRIPVSINATTNDKKHQYEKRPIKPKRTKLTQSMRQSKINRTMDDSILSNNSCHSDLPIKLSNEIEAIYATIDHNNNNNDKSKKNTECSNNNNKEYHLDNHDDSGKQGDTTRSRCHTMAANNSGTDIPKRKGSILRSTSRRFSKQEDWIKRRSQSVSNMITNRIIPNIKDGGRDLLTLRRSSKCKTKDENSKKHGSIDTANCGTIQRKTIEVIRDNVECPLEIVSSAAEAMATAKRVVSMCSSEYDSFTQNQRSSKEMPIPPTPETNSDCCTYYYTGSCVATHDYTSTDPSEIYVSFNAGDQFYIVQQPSELSSGWLLVERIDKSQFGYAPESYMDIRQFDDNVAILTRVSNNNNSTNENDDNKNVSCHNYPELLIQTALVTMSTND